MRISLFVRIVKSCEQNSRFFIQRRNVVGLLEFSPYQKIPADYTDEYLRIDEGVCQSFDPGFWVRVPTKSKRGRHEEVDGYE